MSDPQDKSVKTKKKVTAGSVVSGIITALLLVIIVFLVYSMYTGTGEGVGVGGIRFMSVLTGSMEPVIRPGDLVIIKKVAQSDLAVGDIVTFRLNESGSTVFLTHRIIGVDEDGYITRGDANNSDDPGRKTYSQVEGKAALIVPKLGSALGYLTSPPGIVLMGIIFVAYIAIEAIFKHYFSKR